MYSFKDVLDGKLDLSKVKAERKFIGIKDRTDLMSQCLEGVVKIDDVYAVNHQWLEINIFLLLLGGNSNFFELVDVKSDDATIEEVYDYVLGSEKPLVPSDMYSNYNQVKDDIKNTLESLCQGKNIQLLALPETYSGVDFDGLADKLQDLTDVYEEFESTLKQAPSLMAKPINDPKKD